MDSPVSQFGRRIAAGEGGPAELLGAAAALGFVSMLAQLALLRELLTAFQGNELTLAIVLGNWLLLTGLGAALERWTPERGLSRRTISAGLILVAILPLIQTLAVRGGRNVFFPRGVALSLAETALGSLAVLAPFCLLSGFCLTRASAWLDSTGRKRRGLGSVYAADCLGSGAGGAAFMGGLAGGWDHFAMLGGAALMCLAGAGAMAWRSRWRSGLGGAGILAAAMAIALGWGQIDARSTAWQFHPQRVVDRSHSPYGRWVVTETGGQYNLFENGLPVWTSQNTEAVEETVHFAMGQRPAARKVLLIGGGVAGTAIEALKYGIESVHYIELDPRALELGARFLPGRLADSRIRVAIDDGRAFLGEARDRFDVVIVDMPEPVTLQFNRYYTVEFFTTARAAMAPDGVLAFALGRYENSIGPELAALLASAARTAESVFGHVRLLPGGRVFFLASDAPLETDVAGILEEQRVPVQHMKRGYLAAALAPDRLAQVEDAARQPARLNRDFHPVLFIYQLRHWLSQHAAPAGLLAALPVVGMGVYLTRLRAVTGVVFASGFAASTIQVVLLLGFQVLWGSLYQQAGWVITLFMAGMAAGAWAGNRFGDEPAPADAAGRLIDGHRVDRPTMRLVLAAFAAAIAAAAAPALLAALRSGLMGGRAAGWTQMIIPIAAFVFAALSGAQFSMAAKIEGGPPSSTAARLYGADFAGACLGAYVAGAVLVPWLGIPAVCYGAAGMVACAAANLALNRLRQGAARRPATISRGSL
ncbi:MAG TPA: hypothetical protein P5555_16710 [Candidatus Paceibacterota bacterium]|nr:hypothetical protein [Verrucomicrobiota bacterium]HOX03395.1 hypothetical protein [Verrucomicrobiota bacterium]HRZ46822.1 hypothetical protein [Candidatus Paceibacterota bacterium]HRZ93128.1 hypothetical protein [Candidatus Paceibacterota bacterium]